MRMDRRGSALILVLMMTLAVAGLSIAAIFMSSSAGLLSAFYDREREYRLAAEAGLEMVRSRLTQDSSIAIPDTGMVQLVAGAKIPDAAGGTGGVASVNVYAAHTGDTTGLRTPHVTLVATAYDARGTRHVRRMDLRRESFSRYALLADSMPSGSLHGPGIVQGRAHTNGTWRGSASGNSYRDTLTTLEGISGTGTYLSDTTSGVPRLAYPSDSTYARLDTLALAANLSFAPVSGSGRGSRVEFVAFDADNDGTVEDHEGFARIFDLATGMDTTRLRASPVDSLYFGSTRFVGWREPVVQHQCGAFYFVQTRWHFFTVAAHRSDSTAKVIRYGVFSGRYPAVSAAAMDYINDYSFSATDSILSMPTARCFPAGSPFLVSSERKTNELGVVTGTAADTIPFGVVTPAGGWPVDAPFGYGGSDTTFTPRSRHCTIATGGTPHGRCSTAAVDLGTWRTFGGTAPSGISTSVRQAVESPYLWPLATAYNANSRGVISVNGSPIFVSGTVRGAVTLRATGRVGIVDRLSFETDANAPSTATCRDRLGILAVGDILVVNSMTTRVRRIGYTTLFGIILTSTTRNTSGDLGFRLDGSLMSLTGTVGVESPSVVHGASASQLRCPEGAGSSTASNGGCLRHTGAAVMRRYTPLYDGSNTGMRYAGIRDRCQLTRNRPPFFPLTNRYTFVRTLEIEASQANTPAKVRSLLMRLKGKSL